MDANKDKSAAKPQKKAAQGATVAVKKTAPARTLGKFLLKKKIGQGGMGAVYLAVDQELKRDVALKLLPLEKAENPLLVKRFKAEAAAAAQLKHKNIVSVYDAGETDGYLFIALEYIEGTDVHGLITKKGKKSKLSVDRSVDIVKQVVRALTHAHEHNIVHRDIKPSNLLITADGTVKLADFGLARSIDDTAATSITRAGTTVGTVDYMAPEQAQNSKAADIRSDMYSLGCAWFEMLTGQVPYQGGSVTKVLQAHVTAPIPNPQDIVSDVPETIVAVLQRLMAKSADGRYQTPSALLAELENSALTKRDINQNFMAALDDDSDDEDDDYSNLPATSINSTTKSTTKTSVKSAKKGTGTGKSRRKAKKKKGAAKADADSSDKQNQSGMPKSKVGISPKFIVNVVIASVVIIGIVFGAQSMNKLGSSLDGMHSQGGSRSSRLSVVEDDRETTRNRDSDNDEESTSKKTPTETVREEIVVRSRSGRGLDEFVLPGPGSILSSVGVDERSKNSLGYVDTIARSGEAEFYPKWVRSVGFLFSSQHGSQVDDIAKFTVGEGPVSITHFAELDEAIHRLPSGGGVIELVGRGPFVLPVVEIHGPGAIVLRAANSERPLIVMVPRPGREQAALVEMQSASLICRGIDWVLPADVFEATKANAHLQLSDADFLVSDCSFTLLGTSSSSLVLARLVNASMDGADDIAADRPRIFLERSTIRGDALSVLDAGTTGVDFVASHLLASIGASPAILVQHGTTFNSSKEERPRNLDVDVKLISSTILCGGPAFELKDNAESVRQRSAHVLTVNSIVSHDDSHSMPAPSLVRADETAKGDSLSLSDKRTDSFFWRSESSLFLGWDTLLSTVGKKPRSIANAAEWAKRMSGRFVVNQIQDSKWPATPISVLESATPEQFTNASLEANSVKATDDGIPGCSVDGLGIPGKVRINRGLVWANRPRAYQDDSETASESIRADLNRDDLANVIEQLQFSGINVVKVVGTGTQNVNPIVIRNKHIRLEFDSASSSSFIVQPRQYERIAQSGAPEDYKAFITIENGSLEIVNGNFKFPSTTRRIVPRWFLSAKNGSVSFENTTILGPMLETQEFEGLIQLVRDSTDAAQATAKQARRPAIQIQDSFLTSQKSLINVDLAGRDVVIQNSILVSTGDLLELHLGKNVSAVPRMRLERSTFSTAGTMFRLLGENGSGAAGPLSMFVSQTVFAEPVESGEKDQESPVLMRVIDGKPTGQGIQWWGEANGYSEKIEYSLVDTRALVSQIDAQPLETVWPAAWGEENIVRAATNPSAVRMKNELPHRSKISPSDFVLANAAQASQWAEGQQPIGADPVIWGRIKRSSNSRPGVIELRGSLPPPSKPKSDPNKIRLKSGKPEKKKGRRPGF